MNLKMAVSPNSSPPFFYRAPTMSEEQPPPKPPAPPIQVQLDEALAPGTYSNLVVINHTENEFIFDFAHLLPANPVARVRARIISAPRHTKRLLQALQKNVARYEERYGVIELTDDEPTVH
jgi:hypothetical protein